MAQIELNGGAASVAYDPGKWSIEKDSGGVVSLDRLAGPGSAAVISETIGISTAAAVDTLLEELTGKHPGMKLLSREMRTIGGHRICRLKYSFQVEALEMIVDASCYSGLAGTVQIRTCTSAASFEECEPDFTELLNGLRIRPIAHPDLLRATRGMRFAARVTFLCLPVIAIAFLRFLIRTHWRTALLIAAGLTVVIFAIAWTYQRVKYRLD
jgi:hypothetical protein